MTDKRLTFKAHLSYLLFPDRAITTTKKLYLTARLLTLSTRSCRWVLYLDAMQERYRFRWKLLYTVLNYLPYTYNIFAIHIYVYMNVGSIISQHPDLKIISAAIPIVHICLLNSSSCCMQFSVVFGGCEFAAPLRGGCPPFSSHISQNPSIQFTRAQIALVSEVVSLSFHVDGGASTWFKPLWL